MEISGVFVLAKDVEFIPVEDISEKTKSGFEYETGDVAITQLNSRFGSKIISKDLSLILKEFQFPRSFVEAIYSFSESQQKDPQQIADKVFASLVNMQEWGFLIPGDLQDETLKKGSLSLKENFRGYTILDKYSRFEDTEVYRVKNASGNTFALKLLTATDNKHVQQLFLNEMAVLQLLDGAVNPTFIEHGKENDNMFIVSEWCEGITCDKEAGKYRNTNERGNFIKLIDLSVSILRAFHHLHRQKVFHGDVHPDNIFISSTGAVKIIDYGYSSHAGNDNNERTGRGGTGFYYEPEFAIAHFEATTNPPVTESGEQYSLAVLIYFLVTGYQYLDFSLEMKKLYEQIAKEEPLAFSHYDLQLPDQLYKVLSKALSKDPGKRFSSLEEFALALIKIKDAVFESNRFHVFNKQNPEEQFVNFLLQKFGWDSPFIEKGLQLPPTCSVNNGAAGIAYMFHRVSCIQQNASMADLADLWANRASLFKHHYEPAFYSTALDITEKTVGKRSLYHSPTGIHLTQALVSSSKGDMHGLSKAIEGFLSTASVPCNKIDIVLGRAGLLIGCALLYRELNVLKGSSVAEIILFAEAVKKEIWNELDALPAMQNTNAVNYFGIAHGWSGLLYATLLWCNESGCALPGNFMKRVDELMNCSIQKDNTIRWPLSVSDKNSWPGWCNGTAGHIFLWALLYKYFKEEKFLTIAEQLANHLFLEIPANINNLCCGTAGYSYAMLRLYNVTGEKHYLNESNRLKQLIMKNISSSQLQNNSLYKGEVGLGVLFCESITPALARMPLFE